MGGAPSVPYCIAAASSVKSGQIFSKINQSINQSTKQESLANANVKRATAVHV